MGQSEVMEMNKDPRTRLICKTNNYLLMLLLIKYIFALNICEYFIINTPQEHVFFPTIHLPTNRPDEVAELRVYFKAIMLESFEI
jgi:hypothetical protein